MRSVLWAKHCEEAVELLLCELTAAPGMIEPQEDLLSSGRIDGIGPKVMKRAAAKLGIVFERQVCPDTGRLTNLLESSGESSIAFIVLARSMAKRVLSHHALELFEVFA